MCTIILHEGRSTGAGGTASARPVKPHPRPETKNFRIITLDRAPSSTRQKWTSGMPDWGGKEGREGRGGGSRVRAGARPRAHTGLPALRRMPTFAALSPTIMYASSAVRAAYRGARAGGQGHLAREQCDWQRTFRTVGAEGRPATAGRKARGSEYVTERGGCGVNQTRSTKRVSRHSDRH